MTMKRRVAELEKRTGMKSNMVTVVRNDRKEYIDFVKWMRKSLTGKDCSSVEIPPEVDKTFRAPFTMQFTKDEMEERNTVITEWLNRAQGGKTNGLTT